MSWAIRLGILIQTELGHELEHARDNAQGTNNSSTAPMQDPDSGKVKENFGVKEAETRASENIIRDEHRLPRRAVPKRQN